MKKRNWFVTTFLAAGLLYPVLTAEAKEEASVQSLGAMEQEQLVGDRAAPAPEPMQSNGVIKCCKGNNGSGNPETCVWLPAGDECESGYDKALCPSENSDHSNCRYCTASSPPPCPQ